MTQAKLDFMAQLAEQAQGRFFGPQDPEKYDKPTNIVVAGNGIFRVVKTPVALFKVKMSDLDKKASLPGLANMEEGPELLIPKIPLKYLIMILTFYKDVHDKDKTEASALFFWNHDEVDLPTEYTDKTPVKGMIQDGKLVVYCPQQKNSSGLSEFGEDGMVNYLREHCTPLCETHSHHTMNAFWSGTDDANENMTQFYGVWGKINDNQPNFLFRWVCGDAKINIDPSILFDIPQVEIKTVVTRTFPVEGFEPQEEIKTEYEAFKGPWQRIEAPEDWMGQHRKSTYSYTKPAYGKPGGTGTTGTPSTGGRNGYDWYDERYGYDGYGYGGGGAYGGHYGSYAKANSAAAEKKDEVKKNLGSEADVNPKGRTAVEIFLSNGISEESIPDSEETVRFMVQQLIDEGFDHIVADTVKEYSGYAHTFEETNHSDYI